ncbi:MAG: chemotaxis protein CheB, partial [Luteimonas sp.]
LVNDRLTHDANRDGAVVVLAGIGGPDAVRQLLGSLPTSFPRPVLIQQRLDGARHDKLVRQMQRATSMPVQLAKAGAALQRGHVYVLPAGLGVVMQDDGLHFGADDGDPGSSPGQALFASLPASDSAVILLSGSDPIAVDAAMGLSWGGALVAGQSPDGCYDAEAPEALIARGAEAGAPAELARKLATRWPG